MNKITSVLTAVLFAVISLTGGIAQADEAVATAKDLESVNSQLRDQITDLQNRLKDLESRLSQTEKKAMAPAPTYMPAPGQAASEGGVIKTLEDITMSGFIDTSYTLNTNAPQNAAGAGGVNNMRIFDGRNNNFDLNAFEIDFEKLAPETGGVGFRADLAYGLNSVVTDGGGINFDGVTTGGAVGPDEFDLQQAYGEINIPINGGEMFGDKINVKAGKFVTLAGAEVIESKDNWNISRSVAFGFGIPFTHTGVRSSVDINGGKGKVYLGLNNGWDVVQESNVYKTIEAAISYSLTDTLSVTTANYLGKEAQTDVSGAISDDQRFLSSNILTWQTPIEKLTLMGNWDIGNQRNIHSVAGTSFPKEGNSGLWHSYNLYAKYDLSDKMYMAYRAELFRDNDAYRTFGTTTPLRARRFWGHTFTLDYRPYTNLISRLEYRLDTSNAGIYDVATGGSTEGQGSQSTFATELIFLF